MSEEPVGEPVDPAQVERSDSYDAAEHRAWALQMACGLNPQGSAEQVVREAERLLAFLSGEKQAD